jgi:carboxylesterase type B
MTLFGESAGGASVDLYAYAWTKDPILNGFIAQSGVAGAVPSVPLNKSNWWKVSEKAGCGGKPAGNRTLDCMRELPAGAIQKALIDAAGSAMALTFFGPTEDNKVVFSDYPARRKAGNFIKRVRLASYPLKACLSTVNILSQPILAGNTDHEAGLLTGLALATGRGFAKKGGFMGAMAANLVSYVDSLRYSNGTWGAIQSQILPIIDSAIGCASAGAVAARRAQNIPAWRYL